jgi:hypothetical protein
MRASIPMTPGSWTRQPLSTLWKMGGLAGDYLAPPQMTLVPASTQFGRLEADPESHHRPLHPGLGRRRTLCALPPTGTLGPLAHAPAGHRQGHVCAAAGQTPGRDPDPSHLTAHDQTRLLPSHPPCRSRRGDLGA